MQITGEQLVELTRDQRVAGLPPVDPARSRRSASSARSARRSTGPCRSPPSPARCALVLGLIAHPQQSRRRLRHRDVLRAGRRRRGAARLRRARCWCCRRSNDSTWVAVIPAVALDRLPLVIVAAARARRRWVGADDRRGGRPPPPGLVGAGADATATPTSDVGPDNVRRRGGVVSWSARRRTRRTPRRSSMASSSACMTETSHCSSSPGGSSTPRLIPWIQCA